LRANRVSVNRLRSPIDAPAVSRCINSPGLGLHPETLKPTVGPSQARYFHRTSLLSSVSSLRRFRG
jgi:hypothetical protein